MFRVGIQFTLLLNPRDMENPGPSTSKQVSSHRVIIDDNVIAELVNDSDSDEYEIEENQINEDTVSNKSEEGKTISEPPTGQKRKLRATRLATDSYLGWKENTAAVNRPHFLVFQG
jgi:hypothetical protein